MLKTGHWRLVDRPKHLKRFVLPEDGWLRARLTLRHIVNAGGGNTSASGPVPQTKTYTSGSLPLINEGATPGNTRQARYKKLTTRDLTDLIVEWDPTNLLPGGLLPSPFPCTTQEALNEWFLYAITVLASFHSNQVIVDAQDADSDYEHLLPDGGGDALNDDFDETVDPTMDGGSAFS